MKAMIGEKLMDINGCPLFMVQDWGLKYELVV
jgi:hypothetical protein